MLRYFSRLRILVSFALRDVSKSRFVLIFTVISLSTAFTAVFLSAGILDGFQATLENGATDTMGHLIIYPREGDDHIADIDGIVSSLDTTDNVRSTSVRDFGETGIEYDHTRLGPYNLQGIDVNRESLTTALSSDVVAGRFIAANDSKKVVLGLTLADALVGLEYDGKKIPIGSKVTLTSIAGTREDYTVVGILDGKTFAPNWVTYIGKTDADALEPQRKNNQIVVKLNDASRMEQTRRLVQRQHPDVQVMTWQEEGGYIGDMVSATRFVTGSITGLLVVTVFVVMSAIIFINVFQRRRQIGILKSMGASSRFIVTIYVFESFVYSIISFAFGFLIFMLMNIHSNTHPIALLIGDFHTEFNPQNIVPSVLALVAASIGGSFFPAFSAAKTRIADVIRSTV